MLAFKYHRKISKIANLFLARLLFFSMVFLIRLFSSSLAFKIWSRREFLTPPVWHEMKLFLVLMSDITWAILLSLPGSRFCEVLFTLTDSAIAGGEVTKGRGTLSGTVSRTVPGISSVRIVLLESAPLQLLIPLLFFAFSFLTAMLSLGIVIRGKCRPIGFLSRLLLDITHNTGNTVIPRCILRINPASL